MKVILLKDVKGVGVRGVVKEVSDGFAVNSLIPRGLAEQASIAKIAKITAELETQKEHQDARHAQHAVDAKKLADVRVTISARTNTSGTLYKNITTEEVVHAIAAQHHVTVDTKAIHIDHPIKTIGDSLIEIHLGNHKIHTTVTVVGE